MRTIERKDELGEVFTPPELVSEILNHLPPEVFSDPNKTFLDPTCGNGNFLVQVRDRLLTNGFTLEQALSRIYGADIMEDNVLETIARLHNLTDTSIIEIRSAPKDIQDTTGLIANFYINNKMTNIVQANGLLYDYRFKTIEEYQNPDSDLFDFSS